jgi:hypothetical protein
MTNFSTFFPGSGGLATSAGFTPSFSEAGFAANKISAPTKRETEMTRKIRMDLLNFDFIVPPKVENESPFYGENR